MPVLASLGTAVPEFAVRQSDLRDFAASVLADRVTAPEEFLQLFDHTLIDTRYFAKDLDWYVRPHGWRERSEVYRDVGLPLAERAAAQALDRAHLAPPDVDALVFVSTTGVATPSFDARMADRMGFRPDVLRLPVWGLGCAGGVAGLARARDLALARPDSKVLVVALEVCSVWFNMRRIDEIAAGGRDKKTIVSAVLFADGAAAAVVGGDAAGLGGPRIAAAASHLFPRSERVMGWDVEDHGLDVVISREIPSIVHDHMHDLVQSFLKRETDGSRPQRWLFHPGGARVLDAYDRALSFRGDELADSRAVLRDFGNMSSPTVLFVADRALRAKPLAPGERALMSSLGPGFAGELALLEG